MNLIISFPDQSPSFTYGVEFGRLLAKMESGQQLINNNGFPIREENIEVIRSACKQYEYVPSFGEIKQGWIEFFAIKKSLEN